MPGPVRPNPPTSGPSPVSTPATRRPASAGCPCEACARRARAAAAAAAKEQAKAAKKASKTKVASKAQVAPKAQVATPAVQAAPQVKASAPTKVVSKVKAPPKAKAPAPAPAAVAAAPGRIAGPVLVGEGGLARHSRSTGGVRRPSRPGRTRVVGMVTAVVIVLLAVAAGALVAIGGHGSGSGSKGRDVAGPTATIAREPVATPSAVGVSRFGQPVDVSQDGQSAGTVEVDTPVPAAQVAGVTGGSGSFMTFRVTVRADRDGLVYNPLYFSVLGPNGARYEPLVAGGQEPALDTGVLAAQAEISGYVTIPAPARGTLVYAAGPAARTTSWSYTGA